MSDYSLTQGNGRVVIGRRLSDIDELIFFNRQLNQQEIDDIYNIYP